MRGQDALADKPPVSPPRRNRWRIVLRVLLFIVLLFSGLLVLLIVLLAANVAFFPVEKTPHSGQTSRPAVPPVSDPNGILLRVMTYNIWMAGAVRGVRFERPERVAEHVRRIGEFIRQQQPDLVFLQEVAMEAGPDTIDQTTLLAEAAGMHVWVFGAAVNVGLPSYRLVRGNAILSRWPLEPVANQPLAGRAPLQWIGIGQRTLWCRTHIDGEEVLLASIHLTALLFRTRPVQTRQILDFAGDRPALLAGDFNAEPDSPTIRQILDTGRFTAKLDGPPTSPAQAPTRKIDYIFAPSHWHLIEHKVILTDLSDHLPVVTTYRIPRPADTHRPPAQH